jgi:hypothetical protein
MLDVCVQDEDDRRGLEMCLRLQIEHDWVASEWNKHAISLVTYIEINQTQVCETW